MAITAKFEADFTQFQAATQAAEGRLRSLGTETTKTDATFSRFSTTTSDTGNAFSTLDRGLSAADKTLAAFGVHIGPELHAIREMGEASGKTAGEIGLIGTASLAAAAALGGWEIGRTIAKFFDLDKAIGSATAKLMGWGDLVGETAAAKQDTINLAISRGAGAMIDYATAIKFNADWLKKHNEAAKEAAKATKEHAKELDDAAKAADQEVEALKKLQAAHEAAVNSIADKLFGADDLKRATDYADAVGRVENVTNMSAEAQKELAGVMEEGIAALLRMGLVTDPLIAKFAELEGAANGVSQSLQHIETDEERVARETEELAKAMQENFVVIGQSAQEAAQQTALSWSEAMDLVRAGQGTLTGTIQGPSNTTGGVIRYDDYGNPYIYVPGQNAPGHMTPPGGSGGQTSSATSGMRTGGGSTSSISVHVDGRDSFYDTPDGMHKLASKISQALIGRGKSLGMGM